MEQIRNSGDQRQVLMCAYCGGNTLTRDHVPSRVLLDEPYPENLPVVPSCRECNEKFSPDEEYVACLLDCVISGSTSPEKLHRSKIRRILSEKPPLAARLALSSKMIGDSVRILIEDNRVKNVVMKLGRGHALFELNEPQYGEPISMHYIPLALLSKDALVEFESLNSLKIWPEVGSRAMKRLAQSTNNTPEWLVVQPGRYRYVAFADDFIVVKMVLSEYLACEVVWS